MKPSYEWTPLDGDGIKYRMVAPPDRDCYQLVIIHYDTASNGHFWTGEDWVPFLPYEALGPHVPMIDGIELARNDSNYGERWAARHIAAAREALP